MRFRCCGCDGGFFLFVGVAQVDVMRRCEGLLALQGIMCVAVAAPLCTQLVFNASGEEQPCENHDKKCSSHIYYINTEHTRQCISIYIKYDRFFFPL